MRGKASIQGHPIHPMLVTLPIGGWVASMLADIAYLTTRHLFWYDMAWWAMAFGLAGALLAAIPGLIDYTTLAPRRVSTQATAFTHLVLNLSVSAAYLVNLILRANYACAVGGAMIGVTALSCVSITVLAIAGWLGGQLVYDEGVGLDANRLRVTMLDEERERVER